MATFPARRLVALAAFACVAGSAQAGVFTYFGDTTGAATFDRPLEDLSALSGVGTAVHYNTLTFNASQSGTYSFVTTAAFLDSFAILYLGAFNPAQPLTNAKIANDDLFTTVSSVSGFTYDLAGGATYSYVVTGFGNQDFGAFSSTIGGPGVITAVPEPTSLALMLAGVGVVGGIGFVGTRRRRPAADARLAA